MRYSLKTKSNNYLVFDSKTDLLAFFNIDGKFLRQSTEGEFVYIAGRILSSYEFNSFSKDCLSSFERPDVMDVVDFIIDNIPELFNNPDNFVFPHFEKIEGIGMEAARKMMQHSKNYQDRFYTTYFDGKKARYVVFDPNGKFIEEIDKDNFERRIDFDENNPWDCVLTETDFDVSQVPEREFEEEENE